MTSYSISSDHNKRHKSIFAFNSSMFDAGTDTVAIVAMKKVYFRALVQPKTCFCGRFIVQDVVSIVIFNQCSFGKKLIIL